VAPPIEDLVAEANSVSVDGRGISRWWARGARDPRKRKKTVGGAYQRNCLGRSPPVSAAWILQTGGASGGRPVGGALFPGHDGGRSRSGHANAATGHQDVAFPRASWSGERQTSRVAVRPAETSTWYRSPSQHVVVDGDRPGSLRPAGYLAQNTSARDRWRSWSEPLHRTAGPEAWACGTRTTNARAAQAAGAGSRRDAPGIGYGQEFYLRQFRCAGWCTSWRKGWFWTVCRTSRWSAYRDRLAGNFMTHRIRTGLSLRTPRESVAAASPVSGEGLEWGRSFRGVDRRGPRGARGGWGSLCSEGRAHRGSGALPGDTRGGCMRRCG